jgi:tRNA uridine 5-carbamoylmethylation protein Kti12
MNLIITGPRGSGKNTIANIIASLFNEEVAKVCTPVAMTKALFRKEKSLPLKTSKVFIVDDCQDIHEIEDVEAIHGEQKSKLVIIYITQAEIPATGSPLPVIDLYRSREVFV